MRSFTDKTQSDDMFGTILTMLIFMGMGYLFGFASGERKTREALEWTVHVTEDCEASLRASGEHESVSDCLKDVIAQHEDERLAEAQAQYTRGR